MRTAPRRMIIVAYWVVLVAFGVVLLSRAVALVGDGADSLLLLFAAGPLALGILLGVELSLFWNREFTAKRLLRIIFPLEV